MVTVKILSYVVVLYWKSVSEYNENDVIAVDVACAIEPQAAEDRSLAARNCIAERKNNLCGVKIIDQRHGER